MENLKKLREERGISQQKLAEHIATNQQNIHRYEHGFFEPDIRTLKLLADFFDTSIDFLVGATNNRQRIEPLGKYGLSEDEIAIIDALRRLSPKQRKCVDVLLDTLLD
ncbi:MAG: helix-turn-helix transcriptional regulator [Oscillospiraceae bacterium]|jgi:transcriptional regulator with XRE-family HTH domain|nr:helix-turn-helix transcriptional regulator [Oscillospiraceae bacterium]